MIKVFFTGAVVATGLLASSAYANDLASSLKQCATVSSSTERLACYDKLTQSLSTSAAKVEEKVAAAPAAVAVPKTQQKKEAEFGDHHLKKDKKPDELERVQFTVAKVSYSAKKKLKLTFENGQRWNQTDSETLRLKVGDKVELFKGAWSAVYLKKVGFNRKVRVKRVK